MRIRSWFAAALMIAAVGTACGSDDDGDDAPAGGTDATTEVTVEVPTTERSQDQDRDTSPTGDTPDTERDQDQDRDTSTTHTPSTVRQTTTTRS
ncbi:MAG: hypothetical protein OEW85_15215 [Acidimicrobiia bacterium]|nr:hypothetical protein [Acidimicrobiia bacterium]